MSVHEKMTAIANAIRGKTGGTDPLTLDQMAGEIEGLSTVDAPGSWVEYTYDEDGNIIAAALHGYTTIRPYLFYGEENLVSVDLSDCPNLTTIGDSAFMKCTSLVMDSLPETVTMIGQYAFHGCQNIAFTKLPASLTAINQYTFTGCFKLALTELPAGIANIGTQAFYNCYALALTELPDSVKTIGTSAFYGCTSITLSELPDSLTTIGNTAFQGCAKITISRLHEGITSVGTKAFYGCSRITRMEIAATKVFAQAFNECSGLSMVWIRGTCITLSATSAAAAQFVCSAYVEGFTIWAEPTAKATGWGTYFNRYGASGSSTATVIYGKTICPW